jgi:spore coat polysaccharide biosynthesis predicted glycosyltransferase SpsG
MGLPSLILIVADHQRDVVARLQDRGVGLSLRWWEQVDEHEISQLLRGLMRNAAKRAEMARIGQELVEGRGPEHIFAVMNRDDSDPTSGLGNGLHGRWSRHE